MSYASGFMMGTAIVQGIGQLLGGMGSSKGMGGMGFSGGMGGMGQGMRQGKGQGRGFSLDSLDIPSFARPQAAKMTCNAPSFALVSSLPGRRRYRMAGMTEKQARMFEETLERLSYIEEVTANEITGSLLLVYDSSMEAQMDEVADALKRCMTKSPMSSPAAFPLAEYRIGDLTRVIHQSMKDFSSWIQRNTHGFFDASSLASVILFAQGIRKLLLTQQFPSGAQMLWWAVSLMRGWKSA